MINCTSSDFLHESETVELETTGLFSEGSISSLLLCKTRLFTVPLFSPKIICASETANDVMRADQHGLRGEGRRKGGHFQKLPER